MVCAVIGILALLLYTYYSFEKNCYVTTLKYDESISNVQNTQNAKRKSINSIKYSQYVEEDEYEDINTKNVEEKDIEKEKVKHREIEGIINILLVGSDNESLNDAGRSDAILILTLDKIHKKIKLTSIMRDTYVQISGHGEEKINHSYAYGGIDLLMKTIEKNFDIKLDKYVTSDFSDFKGLVDAVGGIDISLRAEEAEYVNNSVMSPKKDEANTLNNLGKQHLDGEQALAYARIRTVGNGSYERTERHRKVISLIIDKLKNETSILKMPSVLTKLMSYVKTNMNLAELLEYSYAGYKIYDHNVQQLQIPTDKLSYGGIYKNKGWVLLIDKQQNIKAMHNFIFDDIEYHESEYEAFSIDK